MDRRVAHVTKAVLERAFLQEDPASFRSGVMEAAHALEPLVQALDLEREDPQAQRIETCPECLIPFDEGVEETALCPWCGARNPALMDILTWAEMRALEQAWPEALSA